VKVSIEKVSSFDLRGLIGYDASPETIAAHQACITDSTVIWVGKADGVDVCAFGLIPFGCVFTSRAYLWLIWTRLCEQHPLRFIRWGKRALAEMKKEYPRIVGLCKCESESSQAWLKWLGAEFDFSSPHDGCYRFKIDG
jgi:hypothetical protein